MMKKDKNRNLSELYSKYYELKENGELINFIDGKIEEIYLKAVYDDNDLENCSYYILLTKNGLVLTDALGPGIESIDEAKGLAIRIGNIPANLDIYDDDNIVDLDMLDNKNKIDLINKIMIEENLKSEEEVILELDKIDVDTYFKELNPTMYNEIFEQYVDAIWDDYYRDSLIDLIETHMNFKMRVAGLL